MTLHVHLERVVVDGPLPTTPHRWSEALAEALATELRATPTGLPAPSGGARLASLPRATVRGSAGRDVGAAIGDAVRTGIGGRR